MGKLVSMKDENDVLVDEARLSPFVIGNATHNITKPEVPKKCLPACQTQENAIMISAAQFPPDNEFFNQKSFCFAASHILQASCRNVHKKHFLAKKFPNICTVLTNYKHIFGNGTTCKDWPENFYSIYQGKNEMLEKELTNYAKDNLIYLRYFIQSPFITTIIRDRAMSLTDFVANTGGLFGLFLGFSFISFFEILYWCLKCIVAAYQKNK